jgi:hypothetical protein
MSTFEKIASVVVALLVIGVIIFSVHEIREPEHEEPQQDFDQAVGQNFQIGPFATILNQDSSGGMEDNCDKLEPVIIGALHDIKERLEHLHYTGEFAFEVNQSVLQLFCNKQASITLADPQGDKLLLQKQPFTRAVPQGGSPADVGTDVRINATAISPGGLAPSTPTTYGEELIPDKYLDTATSSSDY